MIQDVREGIEKLMGGREEKRSKFVVNFTYTTLKYPLPYLKPTIQHQY